jgi:hypothetical protein
VCLSSKDAAIGSEGSRSSQTIDLAHETHVAMSVAGLSRFTQAKEGTRGADKIPRLAMH